MKVLHLKLPDKLYDDLVIVSRIERLSKQRICRLIIEGSTKKIMETYSATEKRRNVKNKEKE